MYIMICIGGDYMVKHVVVFKLQEDKKDELDNFVKELRELPLKIGLIRSYEVGIDALRSPYSFDVVLISTYESMADLLKYKEHPAHDEFVAYMRTIVQSLNAVDFVF